MSGPPQQFTLARAPPPDRRAACPATCDYARAGGLLAYVLSSAARIVGPHSAAMGRLRWVSGYMPVAPGPGSEWPCPSEHAGGGQTGRSRDTTGRPQQTRPRPNRGPLHRSASPRLSESDLVAFFALTTDGVWPAPRKPVGMLARQAPHAIGPWRVPRAAAPSEPGLGEPRPGRGQHHAHASAPSRDRLVGQIKQDFRSSSDLTEKPGAPCARSCLCADNSSSTGGGGRCDLAGLEAAKASVAIRSTTASLISNRVLRPPSRSCAPMMGRRSVNYVGTVQRAPANASLRSDRRRTGRTRLAIELGRPGRTTFCRTDRRAMWSSRACRTRLYPRRCAQAAKKNPASSVRGPGQYRPVGFPIEVVETAALPPYRHDGFLFRTPVRKLHSLKLRQSATVSRNVPPYGAHRVPGKDATGLRSSVALGGVASRRTKSASEFLRDDGCGPELARISPSPRQLKQVRSARP